MGLIKCPDCQNIISDRVDSCPKCGAPLTDEDKANAQKVTKYEETADIQYTSIHMVRCENCKNMINADVSECPICGVSTTQSSDHLMRCEKCGNMISADASECPICKAASIQSQNTVSPDNEINNTPEDTENKFNIKKFFVDHIELIKILAPIMAVILLLVCIVHTSRYLSIKSAKTLNAEIEAITEISSEDGNKLSELQKRYDEMSDSQKSYVTSYDKLEQYKSIQRAMALNTEIEEITTISSGDGDKLDKLISRYNEMSDSQKSYVTAHDKLEQYKSMQEALVVKARLLNLSIKNITEISTDIGIDGLDTFINNARSIQEDYEKLSDSQKGYIDGEAAELYQKLDTLISGALKIKTILVEQEQIRAKQRQQQNTQSSYNMGNSTSGYEFNNNYVTTNTLSLAKYEKLQKGMTYEQVVNILGSNGNLVSSVDVAGVSTRGYGWYGEYGIPTIGVVFQNGVVYTMFQVGLQ